MQCTTCDQTFNNISDLIYHYKKVEKISEISKNFQIKCPEHNCNRFFTTYSGLKSHHNEKHTIPRKRLTESNNQMHNKRQKNNNIKAKTFDELFEQLETEVKDFFANLSVFSVPEEQKNVMVNFFITSLNTIKALAIESISENENPKEGISIAFHEARTVIERHSTKYKRQQLF